jgi:hypothetical protein
LGTNSAPNEVHVGWIWEAVPGEPKHYYKILTVDEHMKLIRLVDNQEVWRYIGQVAGYGTTREK